MFIFKAKLQKVDPLSCFVCVVESKKNCLSFASTFDHRSNTAHRVSLYTWVPMHDIHPVSALDQRDHGEIQWHNIDVYSKYVMTFSHFIDIHNRKCKISSTENCGHISVMPV